MVDLFTVLCSSEYILSKLWSESLVIIRNLKQGKIITYRVMVIIPRYLLKSFWDFNFGFLKRPGLANLKLANLLLEKQVTIRGWGEIIYPQIYSLTLVPPVKCIEVWMFCFELYLNVKKPLSVCVKVVFGMLGLLKDYALSVICKTDHIMTDWSFTSKFNNSPTHSGLQDVILCSDRELSSLETRLIE